MLEYIKALHPQPLERIMSSPLSAHKPNSSRSSPKECAQRLSTQQRTLTRLPENDSSNPSLQTPRLPCSNKEWTETEWKENQELAMNALLELQAQQAADILPTPNVSPRIQIPCKEKERTPSRGRTTAAFPNPTKLSNVASNSAKSKFLAANDPCHRSVPTHERDAPHCTTLQSTPTNKSQHGTAENPDALRVILPSITFVPRAEDERLYSPIHFPSLTYIIHDTEDDSYNSASASSILPKRHFAQGQIESEMALQPPAMIDTDAPTKASDTSIPTSKPSTPSPTCNTNTSHHDIPSSTVQSNKRAPSSPPSPPTPLTKKAKKGKEFQKPYIPYRRWSRTHLNKLTHQLAPRNLPAHLSFTDDVDVQDIPLQKLVPEFTTIEADNDGRGVVVMIGSRFESSHDLADWGRDQCAAGLHSLDIVDSTESGRMARRTPFRLLIRDEAELLVADLAWSVDVTDNDMLSDSCTEGT